MVELHVKAGAAAPDAKLHAEAPPLAPSEPAIDRHHLARMTAGERALECEVLALFAAQTEILVGRMHGAAPAAIGALAHTLSGSARGIGAWQVAEAAAALEGCAAAGCDTAAAIERLAAAAREARVEIAQFMHE
jgi:hypothetical protein